MLLNKCLNKQDLYQYYQPPVILYKISKATNSKLSTANDQMSMSSTSIASSIGRTVESSGEMNEKMHHGMNQLQKCEEKVSQLAIEIDEATEINKNLEDDSENISFKPFMNIDDQFEIGY